MIRELCSNSARV